MTVATTLCQYILILCIALSLYIYASCIVVIMAAYKGGYLVLTTYISQCYVVVTVVLSLQSHRRTRFANSFSERVNVFIEEEAV